jgi:hypothetical protein
MKMNQFALTAMALAMGFAINNLCAQARPAVDEQIIEGTVVESLAAGNHSLAKAAAVWAEGNTYTAGCEFRRKPVHDSAAWRSSSPPDVGPLFRLMPVH